MTSSSDSPPPSEPLAQIQKYYDDIYYAGASGRSEPSFHQRRLAKKVLVTSDQQILDVGCGTGNWLKAATDGGTGTIGFAGIDLSPKAITICKANLPQGEFHSGSADTLPFESNRFDLVSCLGCLEHFLDPVKALKEMVRVAKPEARFLINVPNADFLTRRLGLYGGTGQVEAHEQVRTLPEWQRLFEEAGLKVETRWRDLHVLSWSWIKLRGWGHVIPRAIQACALPFWPLAWQYQVYHLCRKVEA